MTSNFAAEVIKPLLERQDLSREQANAGLARILTGNVEPAQIAAFLTALTMKGETVDEMTGFVDAMMATALPASAPDGCVDIVGTGGDQLHSVNISTMASFAVAGAGVPVAKHGNRSATSSVGSADVLEALGVNIGVDADTVRRSIEEANFGFYFAPIFHASLAHLGPIRRSLGFRTIFNVLGPLANPVQVRTAVIGVAQAPLIAKMSEVLLARGIDRALLVRGDDGLDELSLGATSQLYDLTNEGMEHRTIDAGAELGRRHDVQEIVGGDTAVNRAVVEGFLNGTVDAVFDVVCANAALALIAAGRATSLAEGFDLASESVLSGAARRVLQRVRMITNA